MQPYNPADHGSRKKLLFLVLPILILLLGSAAYAAINLTGQKPAQHSALKPGVNLDQGQKGLVGWWKLNGNAKDSTPYQDNGTLVNNPTPTTDRKGTANGAYSFNGANQYVSVPDNDALSPASITISAWVKPAAGAASGYIVSKFSAGNHEYRCLLSSNGSLTFFDGDSNSLSTSASVPSDQWSLVQCVGDASGLKIYVNGQLVKSGGSAYTAQNTGTTMTIGAVNSSSGYFSGSIADVRVYNRALSQPDIANLYSSYNSQVNLKPAGATTPGVNLGAGLVGWWPFAGNANDGTPYGNNGTMLGAALTTGHTGLANHAYSFNGTKTSQITAGRDSIALGLSGDFTLSAWIDPTSYHTTGFFGLMNEFIVRGPDNQSEGTINYALQATNDHTIAFMKRSGTEGIKKYSFIGVPTLTNHWTMVTLTVSGTTLTLYINGQPAIHPLTLDGNPIVPGTDDTLVLGGGNVSSEVPFAGGLDSVRIYNRALSPAEVFALYDLPD